MFAYTVRPISDRSVFTGKHETSPFTASWSDTLDVLDRELWQLQARNVVIEVDVRESALRIDGQLRADAKATSPAVRIAFESRHGPLVYATDRYERASYRRSSMDSWQHNVRAIALGLEALRKVDRYGITKRGEQYTGWKALPSGSGSLSTALTTSDALRVIAEHAGLPLVDAADGVQLARAVRAAMANTHPDRNDGARARFDEVDQARQVLQRARYLP